MLFQPFVDSGPLSAFRNSREGVPEEALDRRMPPHINMTEYRGKLKKPVFFDAEPQSLEATDERPLPNKEPQAHHVHAGRGGEPHSMLERNATRLKESRYYPREPLHAPSEGLGRRE